MNENRKRKLLLICLALFCLTFLRVDILKAQEPPADTTRWAIKTNLLGWATTSVNLAGEVTLDEAGGDMWLDPSTVALCVVLRDAQGAMVFGETGFATLPDEGETATFEVRLSRPPAYESVEVYAMPW